MLEFLPFSSSPVGLPFQSFDTIQVHYTTAPTLLVAPILTTTIQIVFVAVLLSCYRALLNRFAIDTIWFFDCEKGRLKPFGLRAYACVLCGYLLYQKGKNTPTPSGTRLRAYIVFTHKLSIFT